MEITRRDVTLREERYDFKVADNTGWEIVYTEFNYASEKDKPEEAVEARLWILEKYPNEFKYLNRGGDECYFQETIFRGFDGKIRFDLEEGIGFSPVISKFKKSPDRANEILESLSDNAGNLFKRGLESYTGGVL